MNNYEIIIIFDPKLNESEIDKFIEKIKTTIENPLEVSQKLKDVVDSVSQRKGSIINLEKQGRKRFAYKVKGREEGNFIFMDVNLPENLVADIRNNLKLSELILRYSIVRKLEPS